MAAKLGRGLAVTIQLFYPHLFIGCSVSAVGGALLPPLKSYIVRRSLWVVNSGNEMILIELHDNAGILGCYLLVRNKIVEIVNKVFFEI